MPRVALGVAITVATLVMSFVFVQWWDFTTTLPLGPRYQAVFLANGQTYFGEYRDRLGPYAKVKHAYYLQQAPGAEGEQPQTRLVRRGEELHAPLPLLYVPKTSILFVEDLDQSSSIVQFMDSDRNR